MQIPTQPPLPGATIRDAVRLWQLNGFSLIPIRVDGTKRPATRWRDYIATAPTLDQVEQWWGNGHTFGIAVICGAVSGNLEMTEIEGRAFTFENITEIRNLLDEAGHGDLWDYLNSASGYVEQSPSGGIHFLYRVGDHEVPGNTKIAQNAQDECLAETRGEGGYVIVAPTPGACHTTGEPWRLVNGTLGEVPVISWEQRNALHQAVARALGVIEPEVTYPEPGSALIPYPPVGSSGAGPLSPGDDFAMRTDWEDQDLLGGQGWTVTKRQGHYREWCRPGKNPREGMSATTGRDDVDRLFVFSTSTNFPTEQAISKFHAYALLHHGGDHSVAARELRRRGFGERGHDPELDEFRPTVVGDNSYTLNDDGNMIRLWDRVGDKYRYIEEASQWYVYNGRVWEYDLAHSLTYQFRVMAREMAASEDEKEKKFGFQCGNAARINSCVNHLKSTPGASISLSEFDTHRGLLNVHNGILNLRTGDLRPHDPTLLMTQLFNAAYDPQATCPNFEAFMEKVLPDPGLRSYVQRALGYTLLGDADQKAMFLVHGPSNTGKSTLMETIRDVFGTYGQTAPSGTFKARTNGEHGPTADLHTLRGRRFISTSETAESTAFDEDLLKRLTGRDQVQSRALYQSNVEWTPQLVLWLATNNAPRLSSDDDAVWRRLKMIPFLTQFSGSEEIHDMARTQLMPERNGILNWLLAGLREYLEYGLDEPESVGEAAREHRTATDSVARFLDDKIQEGVLIPQVNGQVRSSDLFTMYQDWARSMREHPLGSRRFTNRLLSNFSWLTNEKISGQRFFVGLTRLWGAPALPWRTELPES